jgi:phosphoribosylanthranilate isomerase
MSTRPARWCGFVIGFPQAADSVTPVRARAMVQKQDRTHVSTVGLFVEGNPEGVAAAFERRAPSMSPAPRREDEDYIARLRLWPGKGDLKALRCARRRPGRRGGLRRPIWCWAGQNGYARGGLRLVTGGGFSGPSPAAGGLTPENLAAAAARLRTMARPLSGVEPYGFKDFEKLRAAVSAARRIEL